MALVAQILSHILNHNIALQNRLLKPSQAIWENKFGWIHLCLLGQFGFWSILALYLPASHYKSPSTMWYFNITFILNVSLPNQRLIKLELCWSLLSFRFCFFLCIAIRIELSLILWRKWGCTLGMSWSVFIRIGEKPCGS